MLKKQCFFDGKKIERRCLLYAEERLKLFLESREDLESIIKICVLMIPDRVFYYPEIEQKTMSQYQEDISELVRQGRFFKGDKLLSAGLPMLQREYEQELKQLVTLKKRLLIFGILMQSEEKQREIILKLCKEYRLHKRLLARRESFRK